MDDDALLDDVLLDYMLLGMLDNGMLDFGFSPAREDQSFFEVHPW